MYSVDCRHPSHVVIQLDFPALKSPSSANPTLHHRNLHILVPQQDNPASCASKDKKWPDQKNTPATPFPKAAVQMLVQQDNDDGRYSPRYLAEVFTLYTHTHLQQTTPGNM
ncbi:hypothetical protein Vi05172_g2088 [Venturia inaequalis]|nr:hypothetical protein Vi05172_g2088 [Venturia inaequalis]